jgi:hypothetical protein
MKKLILFFTTTFVNNFRNCIIEIVNAYALFWSNTTVFIHSVLANKLSLALKVTGKVTDSDTVLVFCLMYSQSQY